jgi:BlaI family transcriptional regulator, penicillinase repressor
VPEQPALHLGKRERQIVEALYRLGEGSVSQVLAELPDPPSYSAVRAMLNLLVGKRHVTVRRDGKRYLYKAAAPKDKVRRSALKNLVRTFFGSTPVDAVAALLDGSAGKLSGDDLRRIRELIERAERGAGQDISGSTSGSSQDKGKP